MASSSSNNNDKPPTIPPPSTAVTEATGKLDDATAHWTETPDSHVLVINLPWLKNPNRNKLLDVDFNTCNEFIFSSGKVAVSYTPTHIQVYSNGVIRLFDPPLGCKPDEYTASMDYVNGVLSVKVPKKVSVLDPIGKAFKNIL